MMKASSELAEEEEEATSPTMASLPGDLVFEILALLPVKSLLRFKSVSHSWHSLISHHNFTKRHLALSQGEEAHRNSRLFLSGCFPFTSCSLQSLQNGPPVDLVTHLDSPSPQPCPRENGRESDLFVISSVNGLVCVVDHRQWVFVWNPSTRESKRLPPIPDHENERLCWHQVGFGYAASVDDYKVVCICSRSSRGNHHAVRVFSLRTSFWRQIENVPGGGHSFVANHGQLVNAALHWQTMQTIVALDLETETYRMLPLPDNIHRAPPLGVLRGCLSCMIDLGDNFTDVWVMKEYGAKDSWFRLARLPFSFGHPIYYSKDLSDETGQLLARQKFNSSKLSWHSPRENTENEQNPSLPDVVSGSIIYTESLVSVN